MTTTPIQTALDAVYASLHNNNENIDALILTLKIALHAQALKTIEIDPKKIPQPNRQGRKLMQSYFKKRGVMITFPEMKNEAA